MTQVSNFIIPAIIFLVVGIGMLQKVKVYECFLKGAQEGLKVVILMVPTMIMLKPLTEKCQFPAQLWTLFLVKLFSSSASTGLVLDIFETYGPDSYPGLIAGIVMSCTETVFYTMSVYFLAAKVTKTRYTLAGALLSTLAGTLAGILLAHFMTLST